MKTIALNRRAWLGTSLALAAPVLPAWAAATPLPVVASFSILADLTQQIGGDLVSVTALVGPDGDAHVFEPTPQQARQLQQARLLVANGLGFEGWLPRLKKSVGFKGLEIVASKGVKTLTLAAQAHGDKGGHSHGHSHGHNQMQDPHAWQNVKNVTIYARNIAEGLASADPQNAAHYRARAQDYVARLDALDSRIRERFAAVPQERRSVITTHDAFSYFAQAYGLRFVPVRGLSTEAEPSARDLARLVQQVRKERIGAIFLENISDPRLLEQLARETGTAIGGKLYSDALSRTDAGAATYIDMMETNAATLLQALMPAPSAAR